RCGGIDWISRVVDVVVAVGCVGWRFQLGWLRPRRIFHVLGLSRHRGSEDTRRGHFGGDLEYVSPSPRCDLHPILPEGRIWPPSWRSTQDNPACFAAHPAHNLGQFLGLCLRVGNSTRSGLPYRGISMSPAAGQNSLAVLGRNDNVNYPIL